MKTLAVVAFAAAVVTLSAPDWPRILSAMLELRTKSPEMAALLVIGA